MIFKPKPGDKIRLLWNNDSEHRNDLPDGSIGIFLERTREWANVHWLSLAGRGWETEFRGKYYDGCWSVAMRSLQPYERVKSGFGKFLEKHGL